MQMLPFALLLLITWVPQIQADEFDFLDRDLTLFEDILSGERERQEAEEREWEWGMSDEIFPALSEDLLQETKSITHVSVEMEGGYMIFSDVPLSHWSASSIGAASKLGILSGYRDAQGNLVGLFGPSDSVTLEQLAKIAVEAAQIDQHRCSTGRSKNLSVRDRWSEEYVACAEVHGLEVYQDSSLDLNRHATRAEVIASILAAFSISTNEVGTDDFEDVSDSTNYARFVGQAVQDGIISGYRDNEGNLLGRFGPTDPVTRAEIAKIVVLAIETYLENP